MDRQQIVSAVERYLAQRGLAATPPSDTAAIVDRFLDAKRAPTGPSCALPQRDAPPPAQPAADIPIVDFVCEDDVREAAKTNSKIYIGPKTIVTPAARDLSLRHDTLVLTDRVSPKSARASNSE